MPGVFPRKESIPPMLECSNGILGALPTEQRTRILNAARLVDLPKKKVLFDINVPIENVYFIESGLASVVNPLSDGSACETSICGAEGMIGLPVFLGDDRSISQAFQQIAGSAWQLDTETFQEELSQGSELRAALGRFTLATLAMMSQTSVCGRRHTIEERFVQWLLQIDDRVQGPLALTHQFLSQMLAVRRATVTVIAAGLQEAGLIEYHRGNIMIRNRPGMLEIVCECYAIIRNENARLMLSGAPEPISRTPFITSPTDRTGCTALMDGA
jgi:CRP-like cAMP-binding protein